MKISNDNTTLKLEGMKTGVLFLLAMSLMLSCLGQQKPKAVLIFDSTVDNLASKAITQDDADFFKNKYFWMVFGESSFWGLENNGIKYRYNYDDSTLSKINGMYAVERRASLDHDHTGNLESSFYFDWTTIAWLTQSTERNVEVMRVVDYAGKVTREVVFRAPEKFYEIDPIIIGPDRLLYKNFILHPDGTLDTLVFERSTEFASMNDKVFKRKDSYMMDKYSNEEDPQPGAGHHGIYFNKIVGDEVITQSVKSPGKGISVLNYRVESNHRNVWLLSSKIDPEKFLLYDAVKDRTYSFELDKQIFNQSNLSRYEPVVPTEGEPSLDVKFSYMTSMNANHIYIFMMKNNIKLYKISNYRELMR